MGAQQQQTQWLAFVAECDVFHYADFNRGPDVPPGEGAPASTSSSNSTSSRRRSLLSTSSSSSGYGNGTCAAPERSRPLQLTPPSSTILRSVTRPSVSMLVPNCRC